MTGKGRPSPRIHVTKRILIQPDTKTWVEVLTKHNGLILADPDPKLFTNQMCLVAAGVANIASDKSFKVFVTILWSTPIEPCWRQDIAKTSPHPANLVESHIFHAEILGLIPDEHQDGKFRKPHIDSNNIENISKQLADQRESHMAEDEKPKTADDTTVDVPRDKEEAVHNMLRKHEMIYYGQLGEIKATELQIDLKQDAKTFKPPPYRAAQKKRELGKSEIEKQLKAHRTNHFGMGSTGAVYPQNRRTTSLLYRLKKLNYLLVKDMYSLPRMEECVESLNNAQYFTTIDAYSGYWEMNIR